MVLAAKTMTAGNRHGMTIPDPHDKTERRKGLSSTKMNSFVLVISGDSLVNINHDSSHESNHEHQTVHSHKRDEEDLQWMNHRRRSQQDLGLIGSRTACQSG
jgi:hypothetical protein